MSHPGDAEAGETEEQDGDERGQQVHMPGPHGADSTGCNRQHDAKSRAAALTLPAEDGHARRLRPAPRRRGVADPLPPPSLRPPCTPALWELASPNCTLCLLPYGSALPSPEPLARAAGY